MHRAFLFLFAFIAAVCNAQAEKRYYDAFGRRIEEVHEAKSYVIYNKETNGYSARQYYVKGKVLVMEGNYRSIVKDLSNEREGNFVFYYANGRKSQEGAYKDNLHTGKWKAYAYINEHVKFEEHYLLDKLDGPSVWYDAVSGEKMREGTYKAGKEHGKWKAYWKGRGHIEAEYKDGLPVEKIVYNEKGEIETRIQYDEDGNIKAAATFDKSGKEIPLEVYSKDTLSLYNYVEEMPVPPFDVSKYLSKNLTYPKKALKEKVEGRVMVKFVVDEEGEIADPRIIKSVSPEIDMEALRVISKMPKWKPGKQNGDAVRVYYTLPIKFSI